MMIAVGELRLGDNWRCGLRSGIGGSLRWHDPDRFDGCDLSRAFGAAPLADAVMMVIFALAGKRRFPRPN
jgi:hypothetical protein